MQMNFIVVVVANIILLFFSDQSVQKAVFGCPLHVHLQHVGTDIAVVIEQCVSALLRFGINEEVGTRLNSTQLATQKCGRVNTHMPVALSTGNEITSTSAFLFS